MAGCHGHQRSQRLLSYLGLHAVLLLSILLLLAVLLLLAILLGGRHETGLLSSIGLDRSETWLTIVTLGHLDWLLGLGLLSSPSSTAATLRLLGLSILLVEAELLASSVSSSSSSAASLATRLLLESLMALLALALEVVWHDDANIDVSSIVVVRGAELELDILIDAELDVIELIVLTI